MMHMSDVEERVAGRGGTIALSVLKELCYTLRSRDLRQLATT